MRSPTRATVYLYSDERLGYLTFCPTNLGTTVRASVHIKLPKISAKPDFKATCDELKLQVYCRHTKLYRELTLYYCSTPPKGIAN